MKKWLTVIFTLGAVFALAGCAHKTTEDGSHVAASQATSSEQVSQTTTKKINWRKPSEAKPYPNLKKYPKAYLQVSIKNQRVYVKNGNKVLYTMYASTGSHKSGTPTGTFHIQQERGAFFYNAGSKEGARYWTSFKDHGIYLFHTVPTDKHGHYIKAEAAQLGKKAVSHGCVRLAVPDAKWINTKVPFGMKVVIH